MSVPDHDKPMPPKPLPCPLCGGERYRKEEVRMESSWGFSVFKMRILICEQCQYVLFFGKGPSIWDLED